MLDCRRERRQRICHRRADRTIDKDAPEQAVALTGISAGDGEAQPLAVTATSSHPALIADPAAGYSPGSDSATLRFIPVAARSGTSSITVTVTDGGLDKILATANDNETFSRTFQVVINDNDVYLSPLADPRPLDEDAPQQTVIVTGISSGRGASQPLAVTARSDRENLIPTPPPCYDVDGDGRSTASDVLLVINHINAKLSSGEGDELEALLSEIAPDIAGACMSS